MTGAVVFTERGHARASRSYLQALAGWSDARVDSYLDQVGSFERMDGPKKCAKGTACGNTCIAPGKRCRSQGNPQKIARLEQLQGMAAKAPVSAAKAKYQKLSSEKRKLNNRDFTLQDLPDQRRSNSRSLNRLVNTRGNSASPATSQKKAAKPAAKKKKPKFTDPASYERALWRHAKEHPEVKPLLEEAKAAEKESRDNRAIARAAKRNARGEADPAEKKKHLAIYKEAMVRAEVADRAVLRLGDRIDVKRRKARREFNKLHGIRKSAEERALDRQIREMG